MTKDTIKAQNNTVYLANQRFCPKNVGESPRGAEKQNCSTWILIKQNCKGVHGTRLLPYEMMYRK
jgi:hypothetical protein